MDRTTGSTRLRQFIETEAESLVGILRYYLFRANTDGDSLESAASELLNEVVIEALQHEARFEPTGQPRAWLLGIAANLIKRRQVETARLNQREPLVRDLYPTLEGDLSDGELFDRVANLVGMTEDELDTDSQVAALLRPLSPDDQHIVRLAILNGLDGDTLAHELGIHPGAARVRLHRAINRLRTAYFAEQDGAS
ncbi:MAG: sigma-70 family RNA polymerase sigma factor [Anaerolineae bacterium]|nr:MAG: sigma-70 family RNA polymerase sigma factor [Anaerolineae bacterium]